MTIFYLCNCLIDNTKIKRRFIKIIGRFIWINGRNILMIRRNISAKPRPLKIHPLKNVLFSLSPFLFFHFNVI